MTGAGTTTGTTTAVEMLDCMQGVAAILVSPLPAAARPALSTDLLTPRAWSSSAGCHSHCLVHKQEKETFSLKLKEHLSLKLL